MNKRIFITAIASLSLLSASAQKNYEQGNPNDPNYAYLKDYAPLKSYIDYEKYPNFKLGGATIVNDYLNNSNVKGMINDNFTETVAGNAMKMASCVNNSGSMNFSTVKKFINAAEEAGISVYGHTLAWHAQQPVGWLLGLMKDKPAEPIPGADTPVYSDMYVKDFRVSSNQNIGWHSEYSQYNYNVTFDATDGMKATVTKKASQNYEVQYWPVSNIPVVAGKKYKLIMTIKGSAAGSTYVRVGDWDGSCPNTTIKFTTEWQDVEWEFTNKIANPGILLQHGSFVGDIYIKSVRIQEIVMGKTVKEDRRCLVVDVPANNEMKLYLKAGDFKSGAKYKFSALIRADKSATINTSGADDFGNVLLTPVWQTIKAEGSLRSDNSNFILQIPDSDEDNRYFFDNVSFLVNDEERIVNGDFEGTEVTSFGVKVGSSGRPSTPEITENITYLLLPAPTPLTKEEKHDTLVYAMDKWIKGMMEACNGKVKGWDLVNEAISGGGNDGEGNYLLQHYDGYNPNGTWDVGGDAFYWQDFMGDLEYVRQACRLARKYGPSDVRLFINDYNLESDWDGNKKLKSLINWIKKWEADGVTKIDGIGTQMHISYYKDSNTLASKKKAITNMFTLMAATGKLVRVSEFDMGYVDASGNDVPTKNMTEAQHREMADYTEWIIKEYLHIIPPAQQWAFCFWCPTDSPANSGWRANTPVGIWTNNTYYRKHVYAGVVRGLGGETPSGIEGTIADKIPSKNYQAKGIIRMDGVRMPANVKLEDLPSGIYIVDGKKVKK